MQSLWCKERKLSFVYFIKIIQNYHWKYKYVVNLQNCTLKNYKSTTLLVVLELTRKSCAIFIVSPRDTLRFTEKRNSAARVTRVTPGSRILSRQRDRCGGKAEESARSVARNTCNGDKKKRKKQPLEGKSGEEGDRGRPAVTNHSSSRTPQVPVSFLNIG